MLHLLPAPRRLRMTGGAFVLSPETRIVMESPDDLLRTAARQVQLEIAETCGVHLMILCGRAHEGDVRLRTAPEMTEDYRLCIDETGVTVCGRDATGALHGAQTLRQIVRQSGWTLPRMQVEDAPAFPARGFYHDVTRGRVPTLEWLKTLADEMCLYKLNQLQLYVEHTYLFRDLTELWSTAVTPLTAEDILELDAYCAARGIELVPSLSSFGHLFELLRTKRFAPLCELPESERMPSTMPNRMAHHTIDPTNPASLQLILSMVDEYMALFRSRHFNLCADETFDLGRGRSAAAMAESGEKAVYIGFVKAVCEHVVRRGRTPMFWGDIVVKFADALAELPPETICLNWGYSAGVREDSARILASAGARQYVCPGVSSWNQWLPRLSTSYHNIRRMAQYGLRYGAVGLLNTDWGDYGHISDPRFSLPGLAIGAAAAWSGDLPEMDALLESDNRLPSGDANGRVAGILAGLADAPVYSWWHIVRHKDHLEGTLEDPWQSHTVDEEAFLAGQAKVAAAEDALRACTLHLDAAHRPMMARWLNAAEAIRLWDAAYHYTLTGSKSPETAQALERWLHRYERQWREVSQEAEMWRMREVVRFYAEGMR